MNFKEYPIFYINEYILGKNEEHSENVELLSYIEHFFREKKKNLTFAIVELVLLNEHGIGETYYFAKNDFDDKFFHTQYGNLVKGFKDKFKGGVSTYKEWFQRCTWFDKGVGTNSTSKSTSIYKTSDYKWFGNFQLKELKEYGDKPDKLTDAFIKEYFNTYKKEISELVLNNHPYFFIIIQPISKSFNRENLKEYQNQTIPYGNLYLHLASNEEVTDEEITDFIRGFMVLWYKKYGGHDLQSVIKKLVQPIISKPEVKYFLPDDLGKHVDGINILFMRYFIKDENLEKFKTRIETFKSKLKTIANKKATDNFQEIREFKKAPSYTELIAKFKEEDFENFLFKRALVLFFFICREFSATDVRNILGQKGRKDKADLASDYAYINQYYHIHLPASDSPTKLRTDLKNNSPKLSDFEKSIIQEFCSNAKT